MEAETRFNSQDFACFRMSGACFRMSGEVNIYCADAIRQQVFDQLVRSSSLVMDLSETTAFDLAGLQVICSARKTAQEAGKGFRIAVTSQAFVDCTEAFGLAPEEYSDLSEARGGKSE